MSLAALRQRHRHRHRDLTLTLHNWFQQPDFSARLVHFDEPYLQSVGRPDTESLVPSEAGTTIKTASSMTPALIHQSIALTHDPPSLYSGYTTEATPTETSVSTGLAHGHLAGYTLLEESHDGVLVVPQGPHPAPVYECAFWFLKCTYLSGHREQWEEHCLSHFRGEDPPSKVQCPLCDWTMQSWERGGQAAWTWRMAHVANQHLVFGQTLRTSRPDFALFEYLWSKHLIDAQDLKELKSGNHNVTHPPRNFIETGERRRRGETRPHGPRQHVGIPRQP